MKRGSRLQRLIPILLGISLHACTVSGITPTVSVSPIVPTLTPLEETPTSIPPLSIPSQLLTPTEWLPYNPNPSDAGCGEFIATLYNADIQGFSQEEVLRELFEVYLEHYRSPEMGSSCRLDDYEIESTALDERLAFLANEQKVDFVGTVRFSVKIRDVPSGWVAGNGVISPNGWILHKSLIIGVSKLNDQSILKLIGTGP